MRTGGTPISGNLLVDLPPLFETYLPQLSRKQRGRRKASQEHKESLLCKLKGGKKEVEIDVA